MSESELEAKEFVLQALSGFESENSTLRAEVSRLSASVETFGRKKREIVMFTHDMRDASSHARKARASAKNLRRWNVELTSEVPERNARASV